MSGIKMIGIVLIAAGILGLAYRGFSYTRKPTRPRSARSSCR